MAQAGAANIQDGVTIDLSGLNQFSVSKNGTFATIGPGLRWGQVYTMLATYGLATPGGRSGDVGVGGYLLGGMLRGDPPIKHMLIINQAVQAISLAMVLGATMWLHMKSCSQVALF